MVGYKASCSYRHDNFGMRALEHSRNVQFPHFGAVSEVPDCSSAELSGMCRKHLLVTFVSQASSLTTAKYRGKQS